MATKRYTASEMAGAIIKAQGYVTKAAALLGCDASTVYNYAKEYKTVQDAIVEAREQRHDFVENQLMRAIKDGNVTAAIFYLKTQGKERGWIERQEVTGADGAPVPIQFIQIAKPDDD